MQALFLFFLLASAAGLQINNSTPRSIKKATFSRFFYWRALGDAQLASLAVISALIGFYPISTSIPKGVLLARRSTNKKNHRKGGFFYWRALGDAQLASLAVISALIEFYPISTSIPKGVLLARRSANKKKPP